jgi:hypothetical protein
MEITNFAGIILLVSFFDVDPSSKASVGFGTKLSLLIHEYESGQSINTLLKKFRMIIHIIYIKVLLY